MSKVYIMGPGRRCATRRVREVGTKSLVVEKERPIAFI